MDAVTHEIVAVELTPDDIGDVSDIPDLLDQIEADAASLTADGAYDGEAVYDAVAARYPEAAVIIPPRATAVTSETTETQRDQHIAEIEKHGHIGWQRRSGYNRRSLVETGMYRGLGVDEELPLEGRQWRAATENATSMARSAATRRTFRPLTQMPGSTKSRPERRRCSVTWGMWWWRTATVWWWRPSWRRRSAIDGRTTRHAGYTVSLRVRKRIEEVFGWIKTTGGLCKTRHCGKALVGWMSTLTAAAYNVVRFPKLLAAAA
jgi:hypothetical protein